MPKFGWKFGPKWGAYYDKKEVTREQLEKEVASVLKSAGKSEPWQDPRGIKHFHILQNSEIVGNLWEDVDLKDLEVGSYWVGPFGKKVELVHDKRVVGMLWLPA